MLIPFLHLTLFSILLPNLVLGQDLSVPSAWRVQLFHCHSVSLYVIINTSFQEDDTTLSRETRISIAQSGIDEILSQLNNSTGEFAGDN